MAAADHRLIAANCEDKGDEPSTNGPQGSAQPLTSVSRLLDQLRAPLTISMFRNAGDLAEEALNQRAEAANEIEALDYERTALRAERDELLQALKAAEDKHQRGILNMTDAEIQRVHDLRRAAIAKAEGNQ